MSKIPINNLPNRERKANSRNDTNRIKKEEIVKAKNDALNEKMMRNDIMNEKAYSNFCDVLIKKMNEMGYNQAQLANHLGLGNSIVGKYIKKEYSNLQSTTLMNIARTLGLSIDYIIQDKNELGVLMRNLYIYRDIDEETYTELYEEVNELVQLRTYSYDICPNKENTKAIEVYEEKIKKAYDKEYAKTGITVYQFIENLRNKLDCNRKLNNIK